MYKLDNNVEWTDELKQAFKTGTTRAKIIYGENQEINETNMLKNLELKDTQYVPNLGIIGQACSKELSFSFVNSEGINLENQEITLKIGAEYNGDVYYINYGNFIVCEAPKNDKTNDVTSIVANDYMIKFDVPYEDTITYPCTLKDLVENICTAVGVELGSEDFANSDFVVIDNQFEGKTAKEVIKNVAKCAFSWARIGQDNKLYFDFEPSEEIEIVGSNFTITNANSMQQAEITEIRGNTSQEGTPTPSNPIEVETVSGDNNIVVSNKNILGNEWEIGSIATATGLDLARTDRIRTIGYIPVEPSLSYTLSNGENTNTCLFFEYDINKQFIKQTPTNWASVPYTITTSANTHYLRIIFQATNISIVENVQLEKGTVATTYLAHQGNTYRVDLGGKNLLPIKNGQYSVYTSSWNIANGIVTMTRTDNTYSGGAIDLTAGTTGRWASTSDHKLTGKGGTYTISITRNGEVNYNTSYNAFICVYVYIIGESANRNLNLNIGKGDILTTNRVIELADDEYIKGVALYGQYCDCENLELEIQLEEGSQATEYSPYTANPIELCKIGNYQDKLLQSTGKNLFDNWNAGSVNINTGEFTATTRNRSDYIEVQPNTEYTLWRADTGFATYEIEYDTNKGYIGYKTIASANTTLTFTTSATTKYIVLYQYTAYSPTNLAQLELRK